MAAPVVKDNPQRQRFELIADGEVVGIADYRASGGVIQLTHTEVPPQHEGKGYGSLLAAQVLDTLRRQGKQVIPACAFIAGYINRHPEYRDMLA